MDLLSAHCFATQLQENLEKYTCDFAGVKLAADAYVNWANEQLDEHALCLTPVDLIIWYSKVVPAGALNAISANLTRHNSKDTFASLQAEFLSLAKNWASFSGSVRKEYPVQIWIEHEEDYEKSEEE